MGQCNPAQAIKIMKAELARGKNLQQAFELVIKNKAFEGSKACITFIREEAMKSRESTPLIFKKPWLDWHAYKIKQEALITKLFIKNYLKSIQFKIT